MRHVLVLTAALAVSASACAAKAPNGGVDMATAQKIERLVHLPDGARPLNAYARFYYVDRYTPKGMVSGYYVDADNPPFPSWPKAGIHLEKPSVGVDDGGCTVVELTYDPARDEITRIRCNGSA